MSGTLSTCRFAQSFVSFRALCRQSVRFTFDGQRVTGINTAASLGLEEGDTIEVFQVHASILEAGMADEFDLILAFFIAGAAGRRYLWLDRDNYICYHLIHSGCDQW